MASTEDTVRAAVVAAIEGIYATLGFANSPGNVKDYPLYVEQGELATDYLMAEIDGVTEKEVRAISVDVHGDDTISALGHVTQREYEIDITFYYEKGLNGVGHKLMITHARKVREALKGIETNLSNTVDYTQRGGKLGEPTTVGGEDTGADEILIATMSYTAIKQQPDF